MTPMGMTTQTLLMSNLGALSVASSQPGHLMGHGGSIAHLGQEGDGSMSDFTIEQLEALKEGTTPGPWEWHNNVYDPDERFLHSDNGSMCLSVEDVGSSYFEGDPVLMAAAPDLVDALIAEKREHQELRARIGRLRDWYNERGEYIHNLYEESLNPRLEEDSASYAQSAGHLTEILEGNE